MPAAPNQILLGTAGHIDHGKTRLVGRLTGVETDRLAEEKRRGISIELGFAHLQRDGLTVGFVDVPGHERFVRQMVAGATGIDLVLLVVAADDGVMPQTREHFDVVRLLGIDTGLVAVTKTDLVTDERVAEVTRSVRELLSGSCLAAAPILPVSSETGAGIDALAETIVTLAGNMPPRPTASWFRMPIDRVFRMEGHGLVVTGSARQGEPRPGDTLDVLPAGSPVVVRSVEHHGDRAEEGAGTGRQRTAINLRVAGKTPVVRGNELVTPQLLRASSRLLVRLEILPGVERVGDSTGRVRLHIGTADVVARLKASESSYTRRETIAELRCTEPIVARHGDRFILRRLSPAETLGGGVVLDPGLPPHGRLTDLRERASELESLSAPERLSALLARADDFDDMLAQAVWRAGLEPERVSETVATLDSNGTIIRLGDGNSSPRLHRQRFAQLADRLITHLTREIERKAPVRSVTEAELLTVAQRVLPRDLASPLIATLIREGRLLVRGGQVRLADESVSLSDADAELLSDLRQTIETAHLTPPTVRELRERSPSAAERIEPLLRVGVDEGFFVPVSSELWFATDAADEVQRIATELLTETGSATLSQLREAWGVTRKWAVPLAEWCDREGITIRDGNTRRLGRNV